MSDAAHDAAFGRLSALAAGSLAVREEVELRAHVETCARCAEELEAFEELTSGLRALPTPQPSPRVLAEVHRRLELEFARGADEQLGLLVAVFLVLFSWSVTVAGFVMFRLLSGGGLSLMVALSGRELGWSLSYVALAWAGGAAAVVLLAAYQRKRRMA